MASANIKTRPDEVQASESATTAVLTEHIQDTILVTDATGRIRQAYGSFAAVGGWTRDQIIGRSIVRFVHPLDLAAAIGRLMLNVADPSMSGRHRLEVRALQADRSYRAVEVMASNRLADPDVKGIILTIRDIEPRKAAQAGQEHSEARFRAVTDLSGDMVTIVTGDGTVIYQSAAVRPLLGYTVEERIGQSAFDFMHPEDEPIAQAAFQRLLADPVGAAREQAEVRILHRDGRWRWIHCTGANLIGHPAVGGIVLNSRDVTERKEAELALVLAQSRLDAALWGARVGLYSLDVAEDRAQITPQFFEITGIDRTQWEAERHPWMSRIHPRDRRAVLDKMRAHFAGKIDDFETEYRLRTPSGWIWVLNRARIVETGPDGYATQVAGTLIDISARKQLEREIVEIVSRERQRLSQDLHDGLGQELTGISLLLRGLTSKVRRDGSSAEDVGELDTVIQYLNTSIRSARALAHGLHPIRAEDGGLPGALAALASNTTQAYGLRVEFDASGWVEADLSAEAADNVYRIAQEALANAMRHAQATTVKLSLALTDQALELIVRDDGRGLREETMHQPGLGLRIMNYRAQVIGGNVEWVRGRNGGTEVVLQVPCARVEA